jgi:AAA domain-containing protein/primase-like protein
VARGWTRFNARHGRAGNHRAQLYTFLNAAAPLIGAEPPAKKRAHNAANGQDGASAHILDVIAALAVIPNADPADWEHWNTVGMATWAASGGSIHGFNAWCAWSAQHPEHDDDACRKRWNHYPTSPPDRTGAGKLFAMARDAWPRWQRPSESRRQTQDPPAIVIRVVNPTELEFAPVPPRIWVVQDWLPIGTVTGNYGDGGTGKTLLSQLLQTSCATCIPWAGQRVLRCKSFGLYCEDTEEELHRRQDDINTVFDQAYSGLGDMRWISGVGDDWTLVNFTADGRMHTTERWNLLVREVTAFVCC